MAEKTKGTAARGRGRRGGGPGRRGARRRGGRGVREVVYTPLGRMANMLRGAKRRK